MHIIIAGDGKVGSMLTSQLTAEGHDITLIDSNSSVLRSSEERYDVMTVRGNCAAMEVLKEAGVSKADLLIAATSKDEINLLCCTTAHCVNPKLHTIARIRNPEYNDQAYEMRDIFGLSMMVNPEKRAAAEIARLLQFPGFLRRDTFAKGRTEIVELRVDPGSKLSNVALMDLKNIVGCQVLVCAVIRGGNVAAPKGDFILRDGDRIFVTALAHDLTILLKSLGIITRKAHDVVLCGGGKISFYLAKMLRSANMNCTIIEKNPDRCRVLCELLPDCVILQGDISDQDLLEGDAVSGADALVSLTDLDELNIIVSLFATSRNVPQVITKMSHTGNHSLLGSLSLGSVVCPRELVCSHIVRYVRAVENQTGAALSVHSIAQGQAEALEFRVDEHCKHCGHPLKELKLKSNVLIASIGHGSVTEIANGDSVYNIGDTVLVVTNGGQGVRCLNDIFV